jgi:hypothetical protein
VGWLGILLPFFLMLVVYLDVGRFEPLDSISHYYYTRANSIFIITVSLMAIFLVIYKGYEPIDFYLSGVAGIAALLLVLFPTSNITEKCNDTDNPFCVTIIAHSEGRVIFHYIAAAVFLFALAIMAIFLFTKSTSTGKTKIKLVRNKLYITCGVIMILALLIILQSRWSVLIPEDFYNANHLTFWMESVAVWCFGISWLVKGLAKS